jgi:hypothetical protein
MTMKALVKTGIIRFTESAEEELQLLQSELRLGKLLTAVENGSSLEAVKDDIRELAFVLADLFGDSLPSIDVDPLETLKLASRDINLGRILKERGLARLYQLLNQHEKIIDPTTGEAIYKPKYMYLTHPDTGERFTRREDMIMWFCRDAHVARSLVFQRIAMYERLLSLGFQLEEAYQVILTKPYTIKETLSTVASWDKGNLIDIDPNVANRLAEKMLPEHTEEVRMLAEKANNDNLSLEEQESARKVLTEVLRPAVISLVREVAEHPNSKDAMDFVRHDIAAKPEIHYSWDYQKDELVARVMVKKLDATGSEYVADILEVRMIPDPVMPPELRADLAARLPLRNRDINVK